MEIMQRIKNERGAIEVIFFREQCEDGTELLKKENNRRAKGQGCQ